MSGLTLVIGNKNYSSWSLRPWLLLKQFSIDFTALRIPLFEFNTAEQISQWSHAGKVPVLVDGSCTDNENADGIRLWDSLAICEYLNENFLHSSGWPDDRYLRGLARSVSAEMHSGFFMIRNQMPMNCRRQVIGFRACPELQLEIDRVHEIWMQCLQVRTVEGPWLFGDFSIADAIYAPVVIRFAGYGISVPPGEAFDGLRAYQETVLSDPYLQTWIADAREESEVIAIAEVSDS